MGNERFDQAEARHAATVAQQQRDEQRMVGEGAATLKEQAEALITSLGASKPAARTATPTLPEPDFMQAVKDDNDAFLAELGLKPRKQHSS